MANHYLFYGPDTYRSSEKVHSLIDRYLDSSLGDTNLARLDGKVATIDEISRQIFAIPFMVKKRLVVLEDFLLESNTERQSLLEDTLAKIPQSTIVVFWERGVPDKRTALFKKLNIDKKAQSFDSLNERQIEAWINEFLTKNNKTILPLATQKLIEIVGPDLWRMSNELNKLVAGVKDEQITPDLVERLVHFDDEAKTFDLIDALFINNDANKAISSYQKIIKTGEHPLVILSLIANTHSKTMMVKSWKESGLSQIEISKKIKIHPFALKKIYDYYIRIDWQLCKSRQKLIIEVDSRMKSGKLEVDDAIIYLIAKWNDNS